MKLYYSAGSCSTSCHLTLEESGLPYEAIEVDFDNASDPNVAAVGAMNPLGTLPILITDDGKQLDQNLAIHTYVAEKTVGKNLLPPVGTVERAEAMNMLSFVATDLHKGVGALFGLAAYENDKPVQAAVRTNLLAKANEYLKYLDTKVAKNEFIAGKNFTPADAYAFVVTGWTKWLEVPLTPFPNVEKYLARLAVRPAFAKVLKEEGLT